MLKRGFLFAGQDQRSHREEKAPHRSGLPHQVADPCADSVNVVPENGLCAVGDGRSGHRSGGVQVGHLDNGRNTPRVNDSEL